MKKTPIIVTVIVVLFLLLGFALYKISPKAQPALNLDYFDISSVKPVSQPREVGPDDHVLGSTQAKNTMVVYEDIECPVCRAFKPVLESMPSVLKDTKVVFRHYPLYPSPHPNSLAAAYAAEAASAQGKFWEFADLMYDRQDEWSNLPNPLDKMAEIAQAAGVPNIEQFKSDVLSSKYKDKIKNDDFEALGLQAGGTPTLYFNGKEIPYNPSIDAIKQAAEKLYK